MGRRRFLLLQPAAPMAFAPVFDPCREWLGIDASDLGDPRRVLGLPPIAVDPEAVALAAEARLAALGLISPGPFAKAHALLVARVEQARDELLGTVAARPSFAAATGPAGDAFPVPVATPRRGARRRRRSSGGGMLMAAILALGAAVAVLAFLVLRPAALQGPRVAAVGTQKQGGEQGTGGRQPAAPGRTPAAEQQARRDEAEAARREAERAEREAAKERAREEAARLRREQEEQARRDREAAMAEQERAAAAERAEAERLEAEQRRLAAEQAAQVDAALREAYAALQREDFVAADRQIAAAEKQAGDDVDSAKRVEAWRLLAGYAREFTTYRAKAFLAANEGREYEVDGERFAVIEINPAMFIYKRAGTIERVPRAAVDPRIEMAVVEAWFAGDGRAANHLFLAAHWFCLDPPDLRRARAEWARAGAGGEVVAPLIALIDDPVVRRAGR